MTKLANGIGAGILGAVASYLVGIPLPLPILLIMLMAGARLLMLRATSQGS